MITEQFKTGGALLGSTFGLGVSVLGAPPVTNALLNIAPAYLYQQYADDADLQAFVDAFNSIAQQYLDWFNTTSLPVYTSSAISGLLLDWTAGGIYGISRPSLATTTTTSVAGINSGPINTAAINDYSSSQSGTFSIVTDDIFKRCMTWALYLGDGKQMSAQWLRRRVARFIYGVGGADIDIANLTGVNIVLQPIAAPAAPVLASVAGGTIAATTYFVKVTYVTPLGETVASVESSLAVALDYLLVVDSPVAESGATSYNVYVSTTTGTETKQNSVAIAIGTNWTEPTTGLIAGAALPASNTSVPAHNAIITVPNTVPGQALQNLVAQGLLALPFQMSFTVLLS